MADGLADAKIVDYNTGGSISLVSLYPSQPGDYRFSVKTLDASNPLFKGADTSDTRRENFGFGYAPSQLFVLNNLFPLGAVGEPAYQFRYSSYYVWHGSLGSILTWSSHLFGYQTVASDLPGTGTSTFAAVSRGYQYFVPATAPGQPRVQESNTDGSGTVVVDHAQRTVTVRFTIVNTGQPIGTVSGTGTMVAGTNQFRGTLTGDTYPLAGTFTGTFFGPRGAEMGFAYALTGN